MEEKWYDPKVIEKEYREGVTYKEGMTERGLYKQAQMNERFFCGDQWHGVQCGSERPLVRHNVIKRIGDYKIAVVGAASVTVNYSADGIPLTAGEKDRIADERQRLSDGETTGKELSDGERINLIMGAMGDYFRVSAERMKFDDKKTAVLRNAYLTGTGVLYTYWDESLQTGLYADEGHTAPIKGDIRCEVLDIENVYFGDVGLDDVQRQPYILLARRQRVDDIKRRMRHNRRPQDEIDSIKAEDSFQYDAGENVDNEPESTKKAIVLTKLYKEYDENGDWKIMAVEVCGKATVRRPWDTLLRLYPIAKMNWESRRGCVYGDSEVTHLIPNQIAINRALTASVWAVMAEGMPIMMVNRDNLSGEITNDPGQIVSVYGSLDDTIKYVAPPNFSPQFDNLINGLITNTLMQSGANDAALGNMRPDNTSAIVAVREAATMPMQIVQNRFYSFIEDVARIWAEFWVALYGKRSLRIVDKNGEWYLPFDGAQYRNLLISTKVDVGASGIWSEAQSIQTLDNLFAAKIIDVQQYLERMPRGVVPDLNGLLRDYKEQAAAQQAAAQQASAEPPAAAPEVLQQTAMPQADPVAVAQQLPEEYRQAFAQMTPEEQTEVARTLGM